MSVDTALAALQKELDSMRDVQASHQRDSRDVSDGHELLISSLDQRIDTLRSESTVLPQLEAQISDGIAWRDKLVEWHTKLAAELESPSIVKPRTPQQTGLRMNLLLSLHYLEKQFSPGDGGHMVRRLEDTGYSLETLRLGALMRESGFTEAPPRHGESFGQLPWFGSLPVVEQRLKQLTERRELAKRRIEEALLSDADREQRAKDEKARVAQLNAQPQRKTRGDGSQYLKYPDGRVEELASVVTS